ncbi:hypothetical protein BBP40_009946 [Aspergillus hancockii]|nr:hypothetical protein BBP40_009946 [Aspergillus hancockii]
MTIAGRSSPSAALLFPVRQLRAGDQPAVVQTTTPVSPAIRPPMAIPLIVASESTPRLATINFLILHARRHSAPND